MAWGIELRPSISLIGTLGESFPALRTDAPPKKGEGHVGGIQPRQYRVYSSTRHGRAFLRVLTRQTAGKGAESHYGAHGGRSETPALPAQTVAFHAKR